MSLICYTHIHANTTYMAINHAISSLTFYPKGNFSTSTFPPIVGILLFLLYIQYNLDCWLKSPGEIIILWGKYTILWNLNTDDLFRRSISFWSIYLVSIKRIKFEHFPWWVLFQNFWNWICCKEMKNSNSSLLDLETF